MKDFNEFIEKLKEKLAKEQENWTNGDGATLVSNEVITELAQEYKEVLSQNVNGTPLQKGVDSHSDNDSPSDCTHISKADVLEMMDKLEGSQPEVTWYELKKAIEER